MSRKLVGTYNLGSESVRLYLSGDIDGALFWLCPGDNKGPYIELGVASSWASEIGLLLHEAMEFSMTRMDLRYQPCLSMANSPCEFLFVMDHEKFSDATARATLFVASCLTDLRKAYSAAHRG